MNINRRLGISVASVAVAGLALTGCGTGGGGGASVADSKAITWMTVVHTPTTPEKNSPIETALEEATGFDVDFTWIPAASSTEKLASALASNSLADVVTLNSITSSPIRKALSNGQFWEVSEYLDDYPNLSKIDEQTRADASIDGQLYGVPMLKYKARYGVLVRQDWLDNLGLEVPHTLEDLADVARAFTNDDPDGNGNDDTTGFIDRQESFGVGLRSLSGYFGAGSVFELDGNNEMVASFTTDAFKEAMEWYRGLYNEGAVNQEFVTLQKQNQYDAIAQSKGGIVVTGLFEAKGFMSLSESADPNTTMEWALVDDMTYGDVPRRILTDTAGGIGGWYAMPKSEVKDEEELRSVLDFLDKMSSEEVFGIMTNGIEGEHFEYDADGAVSVIDQNVWDREVQPFLSSRMSDVTLTYPSNSPYQNEAEEKMAAQVDYAITNPAQSLTSATFDSRWNEVNTAIGDAYTKYMVGQYEMEDYEAAIEKERAGDLGKIEAEFTAAYNEING
ncbi:sugar ABC transporter substrate-binding protein [Microbacterium sorbitolivorans]|uniref:Extracellular solute-binding protein n=1 Tax=Microbacterium sorbitolivorans TaxID=1867410 RepID=A0A367Y8D0_9MICO|nr:extracellular solute-binding protein [Microbacterium sorbitolivorans]RCK62088.1 extracellular solute-binding protein [Microbacterium sorbitolivorans]GGF43311.1 sugar ABC transporter substrate-binding protein [Microbacterium sorbitolivorans]